MPDRDIARKSPKGCVGLFAGCLVLLAIALAWLYGLGTPEFGNLPRRFSSSGWKAADTGSDIRCSMLADLRHRIGLKGKTEAEILALLGEDDDEASGPPRMYFLCPSLADYHILEIEWSNGRVVSTTVRET